MAIMNSPHKKPRYQQSNSSPFSKAPTTTSSIILGSKLPPAPEVDEKYSQAVFTHPSAAKNSVNQETTSYDRLEFLGDAYIEVIASQLIYDRLSKLPAGRMSQVREILVKNETLARLTEAYGWDRRIKGGQQLQRESAHAWLKIKGDVFEAYVAAVVLSYADGVEKARTWLSLLWEATLESFAAKTPASDRSKSELAAKIVHKGIKIDYVDETRPVIHKGQGLETYCVGAYLTGWGLGEPVLRKWEGIEQERCRPGGCCCRAEESSSHRRNHCQEGLSAL